MQYIVLYFYNQKRFHKIYRIKMYDCKKYLDKKLTLLNES